MRYYDDGERVLANCGSRTEPRWQPGLVLEREGAPYSRDSVLVRLDREDDGRQEWYFTDLLLIRDNARNRRAKGLVSK